MSSGATAAAHLSQSGFDTHTGHDDLNNGQRPALADLLSGIDYIIDTLNLSDRDVYYTENNDGVWRTDYNHARAIKRTDLAFLYGTR